MPMTVISGQVNGRCG